MSKDALDGWRVDGKITATEQATQPGDVPILDSTGKIPDELINAVEVDDFYTESTDDDAVTMDENKVWRLNGWEGLEERVGDAEDDIDGLSTRMGTAETALNAKQAKLTFDSAPTAGSTNPVKSGGVYTALDAKASKVEVSDGLALKADITYVDTNIDPIISALVSSSPEDFIHLIPPVDCTELLTMYKGDAALIESPIINATGCTSLEDVFRGCTNLKTVRYIHTPNVTTMNAMFRDCSSLTSIPALDTSNVTYMGYMFRDCSSLTSIPALDTSSVTIMTRMFFGCSSLTSVTFAGSVVPPYGSNMFGGTPIASGNGYIFVPDNLVEAYKTADGWSAHAGVIYGHSDKENMTSQVQQMATMNIKNKPSEEELQLMMLGVDDAEHRDNERC